MKISVRQSVRVTVLTCLCFWLTVTMLHAQMRVGQPSGAPDGSAALDVSGGPYSSGSMYRGLLPPKVALTQTTQATPVTAPATGLLVYNTAQTGDVTPGYYYWEGKKWARLSTAAPGAGRVGAAGDPVPAYTLLDLNNMTTAPNAVFMLIEPGQEGLFRNTPIVNTTNGAIDIIRDDIQEDAIRSQGVIVGSGTIMQIGGQRFKRVLTDGTINVKWFGAKGNGGGAHDDIPIQAAVNCAKSLLSIGNKGTVYFPPGRYGIYYPIDVTKTSGLVLRGSGSRYINSMLIGNTGSRGDIMVDFSGSSNSGCENLGFEAYDGAHGFASTIGIQFALNAPTINGGQGGLYCIVKNCWFKLPDDLSANGGIGSIGILNCRAEEFALSDCLIQANIGCIFSYKKELNDAGFAYTVSSPYTTLATGSGSMGVVNFSGQNSITNFSKVQPALVLNGTNSVNFHGYMGRISNTGIGTNEAAIVFSGPITYNATINATVESFAQLMRVRSPLLNSTIYGVVANQVNDGSSFPDGTTRPPVIDVTNAGKIHGCKVNITFGNDQAETGGRYLLYDGGVNATQLLNNEISCSQWLNNSYVTSANLLAKSENTSFKTATPFEKKSGALSSEIVNSQTISTAGWTTNSYNLIVPTGTLAVTKVYVMKVIWGQPGVDQVVQSYIFPMSGTDYKNNPVLPTLTPTTISWGTIGRSISIRYKAPNVFGQTSYGLEAAINTPDMNNGTLSITIAPLL